MTYSYSFHGIHSENLARETTTGTSNFVILVTGERVALKLVLPERPLGYVIAHDKGEEVISSDAQVFGVGKVDFGSQKVTYDPSVLNNPAILADSNYLNAKEVGEKHLASIIDLLDWS